MLLDALKFLSEHADPTAEPGGQSDPRRKVTYSGSARFEDVIPAPLRAHRFDTVQSFASFIRDARNAPNPQVFVRRDAAMAYLDADDRRETAILPLNLTRAFSAWMAGMRGMPKDLIDWMHMELGIRKHPFLNALARVDFQRFSNSKHEHTHQKDSFGRSVEEAVQGVDDFQEDIVLQSIKVFQIPGVTGVVRNLPMNVKFDHQREEIRLYLPEDQIQAILADVLGDAMGFIDGSVNADTDGEGIPIFRGSDAVGVGVGVSAPLGTIQG